MAKKQAILHLTLFYVISILLLLFSYYSMLHAAAELYGLGTGNNIFNVIIRVFIIVSSLICLVINQFRIKSTALNNIVVLWVIWMLIAGFVRPEKYFSNMTNVLFWPALYFLFYYFSRNLINRRRVLYLILFVFIEVSLFYYVVTQDKNTNLIDRIASVNHIYYVLLLVPWLFVTKKSWVINCLLFLIMIMTINSAKRGAMLALLISSVFYIYYTYFKGGAKNKSSIMTYVAGMAFVLGGYLAFDYYNTQSQGYIVTRFENIDEDQGSGRLEIYEDVWNKISTAPLENILMGHGHNEVINVTSLGLSAHNDYLEVFYDYGIIGLILFCSILFVLLKRTVVLIRFNSEYKIAYLAAFLIFLLMTAISHLILYPTYIIYLFAFLGYFELDIDSQIKKEKT